MLEQISESPRAFHKRNIFLLDWDTPSMVHSSIRMSVRINFPTWGDLGDKFNTCWLPAPICRTFLSRLHQCKVKKKKADEIKVHCLLTLGIHQENWLRDPAEEDSSSASVPVSTTSLQQPDLNRGLNLTAPEIKSRTATHLKQFSVSQRMPHGLVINFVIWMADLRKDEKQKNSQKVHCFQMSDSSLLLD